MNVYLIRNNVTGKVYIGITKRDVRIRFLEHIRNAVRGKKDQGKLYSSIRFHGAESFSCEHLCSALSREDMLFLETYFIEAFDSIRSGYNSTHGGYHPIHGEESKRKMGAAAKGRVYGPEVRAKLSAARLGKKQTPERRAAQAARLAARNTSPSHRSKVAATRFSRTLEREPDSHGRVSRVTSSTTDRVYWRGRVCKDGHRYSTALYGTREEADAARRELSLSLYGPKPSPSKFVHQERFHVPHERAASTRINHSS